MKNLALKMQYMENQEKKYVFEKEKNRETKETNGIELDEEMRTAAIRERAEYLVKEVQNATTQVQNVVLHIQHVLSALKILRQQLQLTTVEGAPSIGEDQRVVAQLKQKIIEHKKELLGMKEDLVRALVEEGRDKKTVPARTSAEARAIVEKIMVELGIEE